ncbi:MAG TPA: hypothetical protein PLP34_05795, partial [Chitinophagaceae bacterium]|nr:hypothetical protein [Chitinophagaceae bacterium]
TSTGNISNTIASTETVISNRRATTIYPMSCEKKKQKPATKTTAATLTACCFALLYVPVLKKIKRLFSFYPTKVDALV